MDTYVIVIQNESDSKPYKDCLPQTTPYKSNTNITSLFDALQHKPTQTYLIHVNISNEGQKPCNITWKALSQASSDENIIEAKLADLEAILLQLSDLLPPPGSCLLNIRWFVSGQESLNIKQWSPTLGALKKLNAWHLAEINVVDETMRDETTMIASFVGGVCIPTCDFSLFDATCIWRGSLDISPPDGSEPRLFPGFSIHKHVDTKFFVKKNSEEIESTDCSLWIGDVLKVLDLIDITTIPLLYRSKHMFTMKCSVKNEAGQKLMDSLKKYKHGAFLCRFDYALSDEAFPPCEELCSDNWKNALLSGERDLEHPKFRVDCEQRLAHFLITSPSETLNGLQSSMLQFDVLALQSVDELNLGPLIEQIHKHVYDIQANDISCSEEPDLRPVNPEVLSSMDDMFTFVMQQLIKCRKSEHGDAIPASVLHQMVTGTKNVLNQHIESHLFDCKDYFTFDNQDCSDNGRDESIPELEALRNREKQLTQPITFLKGTDSVMDALWSNTITSKAKVGTETNNDALSKLFDKQECRKILSSLSSLKQKQTDIPDMGKLKDFTTALTTSYHGINYNIDSQLSEKQDRYCRRTVEKLVKYETFSVGSKSQVPSPATMNINDSPPKPTKTPHTPGKKKRLQKVAEKLYKKRAQSASLQNTNSMVLRSTPTKKKSTALVKNKLAASPSVHKMALRSSTPTKEPTTVRRRLASVAPAPSRKKTSQKTYVQDNKKKLQDLVIATLASNGINKDHAKFNKCAKRLYDVSMAFLKDLKSSKGLDLTMKRTVEENVKIVLSFEIGGS